MCMWNLVDLWVKRIILTLTFLPSAGSRIQGDSWVIVYWMQHQFTWTNNLRNIPVKLDCRKAQDNFYFTWQIDGNVIQCEGHYSSIHPYPFLDWGAVPVPFYRVGSTNTLSQCNWYILWLIRIHTLTDAENSSLWQPRNDWGYTKFYQTDRSCHL